MPQNSLKLFQGCVRLMLKPVIRFALRHAMKIQDIVELCKSVLTEVATEELEQQGMTPNVSRLAVMTGMHRRDVMRLTRKGEVAPSSGNLISNVVGQWQYNRRFYSSPGRPRSLSVEGNDSEFMQLVRSVSADLNGYTILFELERLKIVKRLKDKVKLQRTVLLTKSDLTQGFEFLGSDVNDLISAVDENLSTSPAVPNLHLTTEFDNIPATDLPVIKKWIINEGAKFHERARTYFARFDRDATNCVTKSGKRMRISLGTFSFADNQTKKTKSLTNRGEPNG